MIQHKPFKCWSVENSVIIHILALAALIVASISDLKTREVPDWISYALIATGVFIAAVQALLDESIAALIHAGIGCFVGLTIGFSMYYLGQWGGGDAKIIIGLGTLIGLDPLHLGDSFFIGLLLNLIIAGAIYGLFWTIGLALRNMPAFVKTFREVRAEKRVRTLRKLHLAIMLLGILAFILTPSPAKPPMLILLILIFLLIHLWIFIQAVERSCMIKTYPVSKLTEGDWIVKEVVRKGKHLCGPKDLGIKAEQIRELKRHKVRSVVVKEGVPFLPSFLLAYLLTLWTGNWFALLL